MSADDLVGVLRDKAEELEAEGRKMARHYDDIMAIADRLAQLTDSLEGKRKGDA